ncbi:MAG TPA: hypothetical protein ENN32_08030 [Chloroflexi bacterium]|nr:hypothetical protein [Chloroflexota bacterium]
MSKPIQIDHRKLLRVLAIITVLLIAISLVTQILVHFTTHQNLWGTVPLFTIDTKQNMPNAFAGFMFLLVSLLLFLIALQATTYVRHWWVLAGGFLLMGFEKILKIGETLGELLGERLLQLAGVQPGQIPMLDISWAPVSIMLVTILTLFYFKFIEHLPLPHRRQFLLAAVVLLSGLIVVDMISGFYANLHGKSFVYQALTLLEASLEMAGTLLFLRALFFYLEKQHPSILVRFQPQKK